ncbi:MAG: twin-arginine translocation pathway signal, partial [Opitutus sp.]
MPDKISRRTALKWVAVGAVASTVPGIGVRTAKAVTENGPGRNSADRWSLTHDRVWLGGEFWANPMEDWRLVDGAAECQSTGGNRNIHSLTHQITNPAAGFAMSVNVGQVASQGTDEGAGFRVGVRSEINEYRSNCFSGNGLNAGVVDGQLILGSKSAWLANGADMKDLELRLSGMAAGDGIILTLEATSPQSGRSLGRVSVTVSSERVLGNVAVVSNYAASGKKRPGARTANYGSRYRFSRWTLSGEAFTVSPARRFGPLLWSMYSLSDSRMADGFVLKLSALTGPMGPQDSQQVEMHVQRGGTWQSLGEAKLDP